MSKWDIQIEQDLSWREEELASLKVMVVEATEDSTKHRALLRALWSLLYAHYEGFCKFAWDTYFDHLQTFGFSRNEFIDKIACFSLAKSFKELKSDLSAENIWNYCTLKLITLMSQNIYFDIRLETECNLWPNILRDNSSRVDLPYSSVDRNFFKLRALVSRRNEIAHGQPMVIQSLQEYKQYEDAAFEVMYELALGVVESLDKQYFKKT